MGKLSGGGRVMAMEGHVKKSYGHLLLCKQKEMEQEKSRLGEKGEF